MSGRPIYLAAPEGPVRDRCRTLLPGALVVAPELSALASAPPGLVLVEPRGVDVAELAAAAEALSAAAGWKLCTVQEGGAEPLVVQTVSFGQGHTAEDVARWSDDPEAKQLLELHGVLAEVSRARHDLNNPLTSALAEVQMLLMDAPGGPEEESLLIIQEQLRRLRDRLLATRHLRPAAHA